MLIDLEKARRRKLNITANDERIEASARRRKKAIEKWLRRASAFWMNEELAAMRSNLRVSKAVGSGIEAEISRILFTFGLRDAEAAGADMAARLDSDWVVPPRLVDSIIREKRSKAKGLAGETRRRVQRTVRDIMRAARRERPQPSVNEISRRIRLELNSTASIAFDAMRAERIARTEAAQDQNTGTVEGMRVAGVDEIEWLAHTDGRSGDRHHERMNGKRIPMSAVRGRDKSQWFQTPLGSQLRFPADPLGPIRDTVNCRCVVLPVIRRGNRKIGPGKGSKAKRTVG
jgi:hypothetical protein